MGRVSPKCRGYHSLSDLARSSATWPERPHLTQKECFLLLMHDTNTERGRLEFKSILQCIADGLFRDKPWEKYLKDNRPRTALAEEHMCMSDGS